MSDWHDQHLLETLKGRVTIAVEVFKTLVLINGGAAIAVLAFWGNLRKSDLTSLDFSWPLIWFVTGVGAAALATIVSYIAQARLYIEEVQIRDGIPVTRTHSSYIFIAAVLSLCSVAGFMTGATCAAIAMTGR